MIFTYGYTANYERGIDESGQDFKKMGKCIHKGQPYGGGGVWRIADEARDYIRMEGLTEFSAYAVIADWETDTEQLPGEPYRRLLRDAQIVRIDDVPSVARG